MQPWWNRPAAGDNTQFLVVELQLHTPSTYKLRLLARIATLVSTAVQKLLAAVERGLVTTYEEEEAIHLQTADLRFEVDQIKAERIERLLAQEKRDQAGNLLPFSNAYRFISCERIAEGRYQVTARLGIGVWSERRNRAGQPIRSYSLSLISATTGFQQLLGTYVNPPALQQLPKAIRGGVCQEVAQQVTSYLGQLASESEKVSGTVAFPTVEDRDPESRSCSYAVAIENLTHDLRPFAYAMVRDLFPGKYAADDPRGDRLVVHDERWTRVLRSPKPPQIPLHFVQGDTVKLLKGTARFDAGISKRDRHRGVFDAREEIRTARSSRIRKHGSTGLQAWYAALPILDCNDQEFQAILDERQVTGQGRGLDLSLAHFPIQGEGAWRRRESELLVLLSGNRDRIEKILSRSDLAIAWSRLVSKHGEWFLQITLRVNTAVRPHLRRVLGVSFDIHAIARWHSVNEQGQPIANGEFAPNEHILQFLQEKQKLEWDQGKGRWIGDKRFARSLESIAHEVTNQLLELAGNSQSLLAVEDVSYVAKAGRDHERNVIFTAWNYGRMRRNLIYKSALAGLAEPIFTSDYIVAFTCPQCDAIRKKGEEGDRATTWREGAVLHCRRCNFEGELSPDERARRVALHGLSVWQKRWHRADAPV